MNVTWNTSNGKRNLFQTGSKKDTKIMPTSKCLKMLKSGSKAWNNWRKTKNGQCVNLHDFDFILNYSELKKYNPTEYENYNFSKININNSSLRFAIFKNCDFSDSHLSNSDFVDSYHQRCNFSRARIRVSRLGSASF